MMKKLYRQIASFILRHQYYALGMIILLGIGLRFARVAELYNPGKDEIYYIRAAEYWAENDCFIRENQEFYFHGPPLYIYTVSRLIKLGAPPLAAGRGLNIASMPVYVLALFGAALLLFESRKVALICAFFAALAPETARYSVLALREGWALAFYACSVAFAFKAMRDKHIVSWGWAGFFMMFGAMYRFTCLELFLVYPLAIIVICFYEKQFKQIWNIGVVYAGAFVSFLVIMFILGLDSSFYINAYGTRVADKLLYMLEKPIL